MARAIRSSTLETRSARLRLPVSVKPTFVRVAKGLGLGYRRNKSGGVWVMRVADGKRSSWVRTIGAADDFAEADGNDVLKFWEAQDKVRSLARADRVGTAEPITVAHALDAYEADLKTRGADIANVQRIRAHMTNGLADKLITLLTARELRAWRDRLIERMSAARSTARLFPESCSRIGGPAGQADHQPARLAGRAGADPERDPRPQRHPWRWRRPRPDRRSLQRQPGNWAVCRARGGDRRPAGQIAGSRSATCSTALSRG